MEEINTDKAIALLKQLAIKERTMSYQAFAAQLGITKAPIINTVTIFLENLVIADVENNRPVLAAVIVQKGKDAIPRQGFFQLLHKLTVFNGDPVGEEAKIWLMNECSKLKNYYLPLDKTQQKS